MLELHDISYTYPQATTPVLHGLNFSVADSRLGIIGPNGCGKTTLLQLMVGLLRPDSGELLFHGTAVRSRDDLRALRREVGFLFQNSDDQLFSPTVLEDVAFGPLNLGLSPEEAARVARQTLENLGLYNFEERITHRLSGGEKKLVALATILAMRPRLLLLDEPTNNLDPKTRDRLIEILKGLELSQVIISHDWNFLDHTTTTLYEITAGRIARCDDAQIHSHRHLHRAGDHPHHHHP